MDRRTALKQAALIAGGMALIPSCNFGPEREAVALNNLKIDLEHQDVLARIVETIIPSAKESPGAESLNLHRFVLVMVDDCEFEANQQNFVSGLQQIKPFAKKHLDSSLTDEQAKNEKVLTGILALEEEKEESMPGLREIKAFLQLAKKYTLQGYMASEYFMTEKFPYKLVPGPFQACVSTDGLKVM